MGDKLTKKKKYIFVVVIFLFLSFIIGLVFYNYEGRVSEVKEPTCTENGYSVYKKKGKTQIKDIVKAKGHQFGEWEILTEPNGVEKGARTHRCTVCEYEETENFFNQSVLPQIMFTGDISRIGKKDLVVVEAVYRDEEIKFEGYATLKHQGHDSLRYDKKNFTVKFFKDEDCTNKKEFQFLDWNEENKFILKANYIDVSRSRNIICAEVWSQMVSTRKDAHSRLKDTSNNGAVDGFPVEVYLNDEFIGIYNLTLHKDDSLFAMNEGKKDGIVIINEGNSQEGLFRQTVKWDETQDWEVEFCGTENDEWIKSKTNAFIEFVISSTDEEFKNDLSKYADVNSLIDYIIAIYTLGLNSNYSKDLIFITYDDGPFIASLFDMENAFGMLADGSGFESPDYGLPIKKEGKWSSGTDSILWDKIIRNYHQEIQDKYTELRRNTLSEENILKITESKISEIPATVNQADFELYNEQPLQDISHLEQIQIYTKKRIELLDNIFQYVSERRNDS